MAALALAPIGAPPVLAQNSKIVLKFNAAKPFTADDYFAGAGYNVSKSPGCSTSFPANYCIASQINSGSRQGSFKVESSGSSSRMAGFSIGLTSEPLVVPSLFSTNKALLVNISTPVSYQWECAIVDPVGGLAGKGIAQYWVTTKVLILDEKDKVLAEDNGSIQSDCGLQPKWAFSVGVDVSVAKDSPKASVNASLSTGNLFPSQTGKSGRDWVAGLNILSDSMKVLQPGSLKAGAKIKVRVEYGILAQGGGALAGSGRFNLKSFSWPQFPSSATVTF